jgi:hypothetical protein
VVGVQFEIDCNESVFKIDMLTGVVAAHGRQTVLVHFQPLHAINYYRRIPFLVHNQVRLFALI